MIRTLRARSDAVAVGIVVAAILASGLISGASLREWSSLLSVICLIGLVWRAVSTLPSMSHLARALATCLGLVLGAAAVAQWLLAREVERMGSSGPTPENTLGIGIVLLSRLPLIVLIFAWPRWLNVWRQPRWLTWITGRRTDA